MYLIILLKNLNNSIILIKKKILVLLLLKYNKLITKLKHFVRHILIFIKKLKVGSIFLTNYLLKRRRKIYKDLLKFKSIMINLHIKDKRIVVENCLISYYAQNILSVNR